MSSHHPAPQRIRLFESERLERFTLLSPRSFVIAWVVLLPVIAAMAWGTAGPLAALALTGLGLAGWTLFEYAMHRFLFHLEPRAKWLRWLVFVIHGNHHDNPGDPMRGLMPLVVSGPVAVLVWLGCVALAGPAGSWLALGFITGYVIYDAVHFACHHRAMRGGLGAMLKRHHMRHHHVDGTRNFAISAIFWDRLFGTRIATLRRRPANSSRLRAR